VTRVRPESEVQRLRLLATDHTTGNAQLHRPVLNARRPGGEAVRSSGGDQLRRLLVDAAVLLVPMAARYHARSGSMGVCRSRRSGFEAVTRPERRRGDTIVCCEVQTTSASLQPRIRAGQATRGQWPSGFEQPEISDTSEAMLSGTSQQVRSRVRTRSAGAMTPRRVMKGHVGFRNSMLMINPSLMLWFSAVTPSSDQATA